MVRRLEKSIEKLELEYQGTANRSRRMALLKKIRDHKQELLRLEAEEIQQTEREIKNLKRALEMIEEKEKLQELMRKMK
jgi:transposase